MNVESRFQFRQRDRIGAERCDCAIGRTSVNGTRPVVSGFPDDQTNFAHELDLCFLDFSGSPIN
jgi:hypothetical protein